MDDSQRDNLVKVAVVGGAGFAAYEFLYKPYAQRKELERLTQLAILSQGKSLTESTQDAIAGACMAAAAAKLKMPPELAASSCKGIGVLATKGIQLAAKGAVVVGKGIGKGTVAAVKGVGKGTVAATKAVGKVGAAGGKAIAKGTVAVVYKAPKAVIGTTVNTADRLVTGAVKMVIPKPVQQIISKALPAPVKKAASITKKVVKKTLCLGVFCGLDGVDDDASLAYFSQLAPQSHARAMLSQLAAADRPNPLAVHAHQFRARAVPSRQAPRLRTLPKSAAGALSVRRQGVAAPAGAAFYGRFL